MDLANLSTDADNHPHSLVGREAELKRLTEWVAEGPAAVRLHGAPGTGKTHLLRAVARNAERSGMPVSWLKATLTRTDPRAVRALLAELPDSSEADPALLIVDDFDAHTQLERLYWQEFLPNLCPFTRIILASSRPMRGQAPSANHRLSTITLQPLNVDQSHAYLVARSVPTELQPRLLDLSGGVPLLLATLAEFASDRPDQAFLQPWDDQRALGATTRQVLQEAPSDEHRQALWAIALPLVLSERLLAGMLDHPRSNECFRWLRTRPYVEQTALGLVMHESFREPLVDSLMQQAPLVYRDFLMRSGHFHIARATDPRGMSDRVGAATAHFYIQRRLYPISRHRDALIRSKLYVDDPRPSDWEGLDQLARTALGHKAAAVAAHWRDQQPDQLRLFRDQTHQVRAFVQAVRINETTRDDARKDPAVAAAHRVMLLRNEERRKSRPHGRQRTRKQPALLFRFFVSETADSEDDGRAAMLEHVLMQTVSFTDPGLVLLVEEKCETDLGEGLASAGLARGFRDGDFVLDDHHFSMFGHDFVEGSLASWLRHSLAAAVSGTRTPSRPGGDSERLDRSTFDHAVRDALEGFFDDLTLARNPLARMLNSYRELPAGTRIKHWLKDGLSQLARMPGGEDYASQLRVRYLEADGQRRADSTSDHLMAAIQLLAATLWDAHMAAPQSAFGS